MSMLLIILNILSYTSQSLHFNSNLIMFVKIVLLAILFMIIDSVLLNAQDLLVSLIEMDSNFVINAI